MKKLLINFVVAFSLLFAGANLVAGTAYADTPTDAAIGSACQGIAGQAGGKCDTGGKQLNKVLVVIMNILTIVAGVVAVVMIIVSGLKYVTSGGESQAVASAKRSLIYAVVGLVVVALSQFIVKFVLENLQNP